MSDLNLRYNYNRIEHKYSVHEIPRISFYASSFFKYRKKKRAQQVNEMSVHVSDDAAAKRSAVISGGKHGFFIVSDFDRTLTWGKYSSHGVFQSSPLISDEFRGRTTALLRKYYPIECDVTIPREAKYQAMASWIGAVNDIIVDSHISQQLVHDIVEKASREGGGMLRSGTKELLSTATEEDIPLSIFSAGVTPIIGEIIKQETGFSDINRTSKNIAIIANDATWSEDCTIKSFVQPLIHSMNKHEIPIEYNEKIKGYLDALLEEERESGSPLAAPPRFLVVGDTPSDSMMADVMVEYWNNHTRYPERKPVVLRVGILSKYEPDSEETKSVIQEYLLHFDIVVSGDGPLDLVNTIIRDVLSAK